MFGNCAALPQPGRLRHEFGARARPAAQLLASKDRSIFQFPHGPAEPRTSRGTEGRAVPYVTPSLYDYPVRLQTKRCDSNGYTPKFFFDIRNDGPIFDLAPGAVSSTENTQSPFIYGDDLTIFRTCPLTPRLRLPGFSDPRQLDGEYPAVRAQPTIAEAYWGDPTLQNGPANPFPGDRRSTRTSAYLEVHPGDASYSDAVTAATQRLQAFQHGMRTTLARATRT